MVVIAGDRRGAERERVGTWKFCSVTLSANVCTARVCTAMGGFRSVREGMLQMGVLCDRAGPRHRCMACRLCWARLGPHAHAEPGRACSRLMGINRVWRLGFKQHVMAIINGEMTPQGTRCGRSRIQVVLR